MEAGDGEALKATCLVLRTNALVAGYAEALAERGVANFVLAAEGDRPHHPGVRIATMHRVKGLEFERVWLAEVSDGIVPPPGMLQHQADDTSRAEALLKERSLLYVAATRAKREAVVSWVGTPSELLTFLAKA
jgi:superfamily I DNA/RNA helicase